MSEEFGSGWSLDGQFDLQVDRASGDIAYSEGEAELEKDLALNLALALAGAVGAPMTDGQQADVEQVANRVVESHPGVASAETEATFQNDTGELELAITIETAARTIERVFLV